MNSLKKYREKQSEADKIKDEADLDLKKDLEGMSEILMSYMPEAMREIREKYGWLPPSVNVEMIDVGTVSDPDQFELGMVTADVRGI